MYRQRLLTPDPRDWKLSLYHNSEVIGAKKSASGDALSLQLKNTITGESKVTTQPYDVVVVATGYQRKPFAGILKDLKPLLLSASEENGSLVQRNYRVLFRPGSVVRDAAIWMQGSCETTHGVSCPDYAFKYDLGLTVRLLDQRHSSIHSCRTSGRTARLDQRQ